MEEIGVRNIAVVGLGYVGLPLVISLHSSGFHVVGFDTNSEKIRDLQSSVSNDLVEHDNLKTALDTGLILSDSTKLLEACDFYIVAVPTPVDDFHIPDLSFLRNVSELIGKVLKKEDIVVFESTVYPGCTEEVCIPILEAFSVLKYEQDFGVGYSPERINPGDKLHRLDNVVKIISANNSKTLDILESIYSEIVKAGVYKVSSIKIAEAAKIIENTQRDINISFVNELALIFDRMGIDTNEVIDAAATKWNFVPFRPGLVGGHCISVDPYYLVYKSQQLGYSPEVILSGRRVNNYMPVFIASKVTKLLAQRNISIHGARILILGFTFKENCSDIRNTRVAEIYKELIAFGAQVDIYDPHASVEESKKQYGIDLLKSLEKDNTTYTIFILTVAHDIFRSMAFGDYADTEKPIIIDTKNFYPKNMVTYRL